MAQYNLARALLSCAAIPALLTACATTPVDPPAAAAVSTYSAEDEALYLERFDALVASFAAGAGLTSYDPVTAVPGRAQGPVPLTRATSPTIADAALQSANDYAAANNSSVLMVWRNGAVEFEQYYGDADADTLLNSKSFAKPLTAIVIGRALQLGVIKSLDQPVADFIEEWRDDPLKSQMLVRHLLDMRTGFLPQAAAYTPEDILNRAYLHPRHDEIIINDYPLVNTPGERYDYSNATSEMIAPLIEAATGREYEEFVGTEVLAPLGGAGGEVWLNRPGGVAHSGCCILLPASDWMRLSVLLLNDGRWGNEALLPEGYVAQMRQPGPDNAYHGMGVWVAGDFIAERGVANPDLGEETSFHSEPYAASDLFLWDGNANQVSYIIPSEGMVILRMGANPPKEPRWDNAYLPNLLIEGIETDKGSSVPQAR